MTQLDLFTPPAAPSQAKIVLRNYQQDAVNATFDEWESGIKSTLVVLPTGCGKSVVFSAVMKRHKEESR